MNAAAATEPPPLPPKRLPRRAELLRDLAEATSSVHLRAAAQAIAGTADDVAAPRLLAGTFPRKLEDGRDVPEWLPLQMENVWVKLKELGLFPDHAGLHFDSIVGTAVACAGWDANGDEGKAAKRPCSVGCVATVRQIARDARKDPKTVTKALRWMHEARVMDSGPRWRATDREEEAPGLPATWHQSTVRLLYLVPLPMGLTLSYEDLLGLAAAQHAKPAFPPLPPPANDTSTPDAEKPPGSERAPLPPPAPRPPRPPRPPKRLTLKKILDTFELPELPADAKLDALAAPLAQFSRRTVVPIPVELAARLALKVGLENWTEAAAAVLELADIADGEALAAKLEGKLPFPWHLHRVVKALTAYLKSKVRWITTGPGALAARQLAAVQEAERAREKANDVLGNLRATQARLPAPTSALSPLGNFRREGAESPLSHQEQKLRLLWFTAETAQERTRAAEAMLRAGMTPPTGPPE